MVTPIRPEVLPTYPTPLPPTWRSVAGGGPVNILLRERGGWVRWVIQQVLCWSDHLLGVCPPREVGHREMGKNGVFSPAGQNGVECVCRWEVIESCRPAGQVGRWAASRGVIIRRPRGLKGDWG